MKYDILSYILSLFGPIKFIRKEEVSWKTWITIPCRESIKRGLWWEHSAFLILDSVIPRTLNCGGVWSKESQNTVLQCISWQRSVFDDGRVCWITLNNWLFNCIIRLVIENDLIVYTWWSYAMSEYRVKLSCTIESSKKLPFHRFYQNITITHLFLVLITPFTMWSNRLNMIKSPAASENERNAPFFVSAIWRQPSSSDSSVKEIITEKKQTRSRCSFNPDGIVPLGYKLTKHSVGNLLWPNKDTKLDRSKLDVMCCMMWLYAASYRPTDKNE